MINLQRTIEAQPIVGPIIGKSVVGSFYEDRERNGNGEWRIENGELKMEN